MTVWEFGLNKVPLEAVRRGDKTIEVRLDRGKFAEFAPGDRVKVRRDYRRSDGTIHDGEPDALRLKIVAVRRYTDFASLIEREGYQRVIPWAASPAQAVAEYDAFYSADDQARYGVLAIEVVVEKSRHTQ